MEFYVDLDMTSETRVECEGAAPIGELLNVWNHGAGSDLTFSVWFGWEGTHLPVENFTRFNPLQKLHHEMLLADCSIFTGDDKVVTCHKSVLATSSDVLLAMLTSGMKESQSGRIEMKDMAEKVVTKMLAYMYGLDVKAEEMDVEMAVGLLKAAHKYNISSLEVLMMKTVFFKPNETFNMELVLELYFYVEEIHTLKLIRDKMTEIMRK